ncbi:type I secretion protein [Roseovarius sp. A21]|uniref:Type I secretion protein n=2 Tax=Roseovarius bejariae TaxID=2576383 RepID=A0A844CFI1_9RHOB|nr:type I secretion protein [Roseovarius bejariae]
MLTPGADILTSGDTATGNDVDSNAVTPPTDPDTSLLVDIAGPVSRIEIDYDNGGTDTQAIWVTDVHFSTIDAGGELDGIVSNGDDDAYIATNPDSDPDYVYTGDPEGDLVDSGDAILAGEAPDDDIIQAGGGNDTIEAGLGDDEVDAGTGDDLAFGEEGNDEIDGGAGDDTIDGGADNDTLTGGEGSDSAVGGAGDDVIDTGNGAPVNDHETFVGVPFETGADQLNDLDTVVGGAGNDTITTGDDADLISGDGGNDSINGGIDDDTIFGGTGDDYIDGGLGNDSIEGGDGHDTIDAGIDGFSDYEGDDPNLPNAALIDPATGMPALSDPNPDDGRDYVDGGEGNDLIMTGDDDDTIIGGLGDDTVNAGIDDDIVFGNEGADSLTGSHGSDTIEGGAGDDTIWGGFGNDPIAGIPGEIPDATDPVPENGQDLLLGGDGNDVIYGEDDDDTIEGGAGDDTIDGGVDDDLLLGGADNDMVDGGAGNDTVLGGTGNDILLGGDDRDLFTDAGAGDVVDGGTGGDDYDVLNLAGQGDFRIVGETLDADGDSTSGTVEFLDPDGTVSGSLGFTEIEDIIPCFTPGTVIATPKGERRVEDLEVGDRVITRDNGLQEIRWIGRRDLTGQELCQAPNLKPVLIRAGSLGRGLPEHDMMVSPQHRLLINNDRSALYFDEREVLAAAKHLTGMKGVDTVEASGVSYIHFMFDQHEVVLSNGAWTESFQPGEQVMDGMGAAQRNEIYDLFPELREAEGLKDYQAARRSLKKHEAKLLMS